MWEYKEVVYDDGMIIYLSETTVAIPLVNSGVVIATDQIYPSIELTHQLCDIFLITYGEVAEMVDFIFFADYCIPIVNECTIHNLNICKRSVTIFDYTRVTLTKMSITNYPLIHHLHPLLSFYHIIT